MSVEVVFIVFCVVIALVDIWYYRKSKRPVVSALLGGVSGVVVLFPASYLLQQCGIMLGINYASLAVSALLGVPGIALMGAYLYF